MHWRDPNSDSACPDTHTHTPGTNANTHATGSKPHSNASHHTHTDADTYSGVAGYQPFNAHARFTRG